MIHLKALLLGLSIVGLIVLGMYYYPHVVAGGMLMLLVSAFAWMTGMSILTGFGENDGS